MRDSRILRLLGLAFVLVFPAGARAEWGGPFDPPGTMVRVSVDVDGRAAPLYPAQDGSGRRYLEARRGSAYAVRLENRTSERLGVVLTVDGLNAISGLLQGATSPGRMYVLDPWGEAVVRGWRTSLNEVRRFTFVDESASYASRSGKANGKMGWLEVAVYREQRAMVGRGPRPLQPAGREESRDRAAEQSGPAEPPTAAGSPGAAQADSVAKAAPAPYSGYPGTGWGSRDNDPVEVVSFDPQLQPSDRVTVRYEYASALRALGILPSPAYPRDRLTERERGEAGFATPPAW